jgi:UDP-glucose 4-epimerase
MDILVTGGAGYIGSVAVKKLIVDGHNVTVIDNLSKGNINLVDSKANFIKSDLNDLINLDLIFSKNKFDAVIHFSAYKAVEESMKNAVKYSDNITGIINLLNCMVKYNVNKIIFSSSAAVYGMKNGVIDENATLEPINFYGYTKKAMEEIISWYNKIYGIKYIALRYFNVAGDVLGYIDPDAQNIFPIIAEVIKGDRDLLKIFGNDYNTPDGTCIRDYIDVQDLVNAHILALKCSFIGPINLGNGKGYSVKELVDAFSEVSGQNINFKYVERRSGDPEKLIASNKLAKEVLKWEPCVSLKDMVKSCLQAYELVD